MRNVMLMRLSGPMQSWGTQSRFSHRDTGQEPSKSGVIGLLCAALGRPRQEPLDDLVALRMGVRVDRPGRMARDFQTAGGERRAGAYLGADAKGRARPYGVIKADGSGVGTVISDRFYLADAAFLVGLEGDAGLLRRLDTALARPIWPLYLGRKAFVPGEPVRIGVVEGDLEFVLRTYSWFSGQAGERPAHRLRVVLEVPFGAGEPRQDVPLSFVGRRFGVRHVDAGRFIDPPRPSPTEEPPCT